MKRGNLRALISACGLMAISQLGGFDSLLAQEIIDDVKAKTGGTITLP
jgi:hypothetical protein